MHREKIAMHTYLIAYDVAQAKAIKHAMATELMRIGVVWARPLETTWYVRTSEDACDLEARLSALLDTDDGLLIQPVQDQATLSNTAIRWFGHRRVAVDSVDRHEGALENVIAFPATPQHFFETQAAA
jgi:hypothetical protein